MTKRKRSKRQCKSRIDKIERKCDRILSELLVIRHSLEGRHDLDDAIDRIHGAAKRMRHQCEKEYDVLRRFLSKS